MPDSAMPCPTRRSLLARSCVVGALCALTLLLSGPVQAEALPAQPVAEDGFLSLWRLTWPVGKQATEAAEGSDASEAPSVTRISASPGPVLDLRSATKGLPQGDDESLALLAVQLEVPSDRVGFVLAGARGEARVVLDGEDLVRAPVTGRGVEVDSVAAPVRLGAGSHTLQVEVQHLRGRWGLALRFVDAGGAPWSDLELRADADGVSEGGAPDLAAETTRLWMRDRQDAAGLSLEAVVRRGLGQRTAEEAPLRLRWTLEDGQGEVVEGPHEEALALAWGGERRHRVQLPGLADGVLEWTAQVVAGERVLAHGSRRLRVWTGMQRALQQIRELLREAGASSVAPRESVWAAQAGVQELEELLRRPRGDDEDYARALLESLRQDAKALVRGQDPLRKRRGALLRAYPSEHEGGRLQPYALYVPRSYRPGRRLPLVVGLHGMSSGPRLCLRRLFGFDRGRRESRREALRTIPELPEVPALVVCPWGYGNAGFRFLGEHDVLRVIAEVSRSYSVDARRVTLTGPSMGGIATFALATRHAWRFAGAAALCGQADVRQYREIDGFPLAPWEAGLIARQSPVDWAENGLSLPLLAVHGTLDPTPESHSEVMVRRLEELGYSAELRTPRLGHNVWAQTYADARELDRLRRLRRPRLPRRVVLKTLDQRHRRADWVTVDRFSWPMRCALVRARLTDRRGSSLRVRTEGVEALTLALDSPGFPRRGRVRVDLNGTRLTVRAGQAAHFARPQTAPEAGWTVTKSPPSLAGLKRPGLAGPLDDVLYDPMLLVFGTQDPAQTETNRRRALEDASSLWGAQLRLPVRPDTGVTPEDEAKHHLILYGNAASNSVLARLIDRLPLRFEPDALQVGERRFEGWDVGIRAVFPNPDVPGRYVVVNAGVGWPGTLHGRYLPRFLPDLVVYDQRITGPRHRRILQGRPVLAGGYLAEDWSLEGAQLWGLDGKGVPLLEPLPRETPSCGKRACCAPAHPSPSPWSPAHEGKP